MHCRDHTGPGDIGRELRHAIILALADEMREVRTVCHCGRKATMVVRRDASGQALRSGAQIEVGGNERYESLCRRHWRQAVGEH